MSGPPALTFAMRGNGLDGFIAAGMTLALALSLVGLFASGAMQSPADLLYTSVLLLGSLSLAVFCAACSRPTAWDAGLRWDGQSWFRSDQNDEGVCAVHCVMDFQVCMLLRLQAPEGAREWIWLRRKDHVKNWYPLRRALIFDNGSAHEPSVGIGGK